MRKRRNTKSVKQIAASAARQADRLHSRSEDLHKKADHLHKRIKSVHKDVSEIRRISRAPETSGKKTESFIRYDAESCHLAGRKAEGHDLLSRRKLLD
jgi:predicted  nucleic acid-binding Zn-ribbon protein